MLRKVLNKEVFNKPQAFYGLVFLFFLVLSVVYTWPVVLDFQRTIPGFFPSDQDQNIWSLWWFKRALLDLHINPYNTPYLYYPYGTNLYLHSLDPLNGLLALPWSVLAGPVAAFNATVLLGLTLTGVAATALGHLVSGNRWAGLVAGYIISFGQIHFSFVNLGQLEFINLWPLLLYLICLVKLTGPQTDLPAFGLFTTAKKWWIAGTVAALLVAVLVTLYYAAYAALLTALYVLFRGLQERKALWWRNTIVWLGLAWAIFAALFSYQGWRIWQTLQLSGAKIDATPNVIVNESVTVHGYFSEFDGNVLLGGLLGISRNVPLNIVHYMGLGLLVLAGLGFFLGGWSNRTGWRGNWVWLALGLFFAIASFGPSVRLDPQVNPAIGPTQFWLPWNWLQKIPLLNISHTPSRLALVWLICLGLLAAQGAAWLLQLRSKEKPWLGKLGLAALVVILFLEGPVLPALNRVVDRPLQVSVIQDDCARTACGNGVVLDLPLNVDNHTRDHDLMLYSALRQQPVMGGYLSRSIPVPYASVDSPFHLFLQLSSLDGDIFQPAYSRSVTNLLNQNNIRYVAVNQPRFQEVYGLSADRVTRYLGQILGPETRFYSANGLEVYRIPSALPAEKTPLVVPTGGWLLPEKDAPNLSKRWFIRNASISIFTFEASVRNVTFEAVAFYRTRHVNVMLNGQLVATLTVEASSMIKFDLPHLSLAAGENLLQLNAVEEPESPAAITPGSVDTRLLSVAVRQFKLA